MCVCVYVCFFCSLLITGMGNQWVLSLSSLAQGSMFCAWHGQVGAGRGRGRGVWSLCCAFPSVGPSSTLSLPGFEQLFLFSWSAKGSRHQPGNPKETFCFFFVFFLSPRHAHNLHVSLSTLLCLCRTLPLPHLPSVPKLGPYSSVYSICLFDWKKKQKTDSLHNIALKSWNASDVLLVIVL